MQYKNNTTVNIWSSRSLCNVLGIVFLGWYCFQTIFADVSCKLKACDYQFWVVWWMLSRCVFVWISFELITIVYMNFWTVLSTLGMWGNVCRFYIGKILNKLFILFVCVVLFWLFYFNTWWWWRLQRQVLYVTFFNLI